MSARACWLALHTHHPGWADCVFGPQVYRVPGVSERLSGKGRNGPDVCLFRQLQDSEVTPELRGGGPTL